MKTRHVRQTHKALLQKPDIAKEYLNEAIESNDSAVILMALRNIAEAQQDGITGLAGRSNLTRNSMYKMLSSDGNPKLSSFLNLVHGLGFQIKIEQTNE